jgi:hypothetical protein
MNAFPSEPVVVSVWSVKRPVHHRPACRWAAEILLKNKREGDPASTGGRRPCKCCHKERREGGPTS